MRHAKKSNASRAPVLDRDDNFDDILGPPALLPGEDPAAYRALSEQLTAAVKPQDFIEQVWVRDFVDITWETSRLRRFRAAMIVSGYGAAIKEILVPQLNYSRASDFAEKWLRNDKQTRADFKALLVQLGLTMDDVHGRALDHKIKSIGRVDQMIEAAEHRRRLIFLEVERRREMLARRMRDEAKTINAQVEREGVQAIAHVRGDT